MNKHGSLFDLEEPPSNLFDEQSSNATKIDVVQLSFLGAENIEWEELFAGFDRIYAITMAVS